MRPKAPRSELGAPAGCDGARGVAPAEARLSAFRRPVAEPSLRAVLVRPVTVRAVRGADIVVVCEGCLAALYLCLRAQLVLALRAAGHARRACENGL